MGGVVENEPNLKWLTDAFDSKLTFDAFDVAMRWVDYISMVLSKQPVKRYDDVALALHLQIIKRPCNRLFEYSRLHIHVLSLMRLNLWGRA